MKQAVLAVFFSVFVWHVYRAATTAVTPEEAVTYNGYVSQTVLKILSLPYNPANQVLHSLLCRLVLRALRITEFSLRVASLLGLLFYFWQAFQLIPPVSKVRALALCAFAFNPLTVALLPQSTGFWMAAGLFLLAVRKLTLGHVSAASIALGFAGCFYLSFCIPALVLLLLFFRRKTAVDHLFLPASLILFCFWTLPIANALPGTLTLPVPHRFTSGPGSNLPRVARELRDDIRRHPPRPIRVAASPSLIDQLDFYRRRYALGAVQKILPIGSSQPVDYTVILDAQTGRAKLNATTLVDMHH